MTQDIDPISPRVRRRFILGRQGLWPGRRWRGRHGLIRALQTVEAVQMDPVSVLCQSHDLVLWGRVLDYAASDLDHLLHQDRQFFDYGAGLMIYPIEERPYWQLYMKRIIAEERWADFARSYATVIDGVRNKLRDEGPARKRDLAGRLVNSYRGSKDSGVALYYLWLSGELVTHSRNGKERLYEFADRALPETALRRAPADEAEAFFARKSIALAGLINWRSFRNSWKGFIRRQVDTEEARTRLASMVETGTVLAVRLEGEKEPHYILAGDLGALAEIQQGSVPAGWEPLETTTEEEVTFLSPLEYVSARGRAKILFDFDYIWEIYKPAAKRQYGPYTLPVLYGDRLVARVDARLDRTDSVLYINGLWLEPGFGSTRKFQEALRRGFDRLRSFLGAGRLEGDPWLP